MALSKIVLAAPRGFCAGVAYAIEVVNLALKIHGAPLYVRHAIVHNEFVVKDFESKGVIFIEDVTEIPEGQTVVFSAHGVSPAVREAAASKNLNVIDATCPLVTKVHNEAKRFAAKDFLMIYVGHRGHVEAEGTMGEAPERMVLVETPEEAENITLPPHERLALVTQTTLSVDEVTAITSVLERRFPHLQKPQKEDICYATTNRQIAVKSLAEICDFIIVVGSTTSSNSNRLAEVAEAYGAKSTLLMSPDEMNPEWAQLYGTIGITSGASTPDELVENVIGTLLNWMPGTPVETLEVVKEEVEFLPSRNLVNLALAKG
ncbi:MAG: 4-hydroxy-3-methylbut-2-enyl diphosphate reductase [Fimbriimonadaceae bacterium]|nr:MAG: 4-hydroxy-3-methylbut-2-enyl diphosphate reductase [Fimbriimonadaceae bacterium]